MAPTFHLLNTSLVFTFTKLPHFSCGIGDHSCNCGAVGKKKIDRIIGFYVSLLPQKRMLLAQCCFFFGASKNHPKDAQ